MPDRYRRNRFDERRGLGDSLADRTIVSVAERMMNFVVGTVVAEETVKSTEVALDDVRMSQLQVESGTHVGERNEDREIFLDTSHDTAQTYLFKYSDSTEIRFNKNIDRDGISSWGSTLRPPTADISLHFYSS